MTGDPLREDKLLASPKFHVEKISLPEMDNPSAIPIGASEYIDLGRVMRKTGNLKGACYHFKQALDIDELTFGPLSLQVALRFRTLGDLMREMGGLMDARSCYQRALEIHEKLESSNQIL